GQLTAIAARNHANQLLRHVPVAVNEPAAIPALPDAQPVDPEAPHILSGRRSDAERPQSRLRPLKFSAAKRPSAFRFPGEKTSDGVDVKSGDQFDRTPAALVVQTSVVAEPRVQLHFPADVIENVLSGQRPAVESGRDLGPDFVPGSAHLLAQIAAERSKRVGEFLRVPAVLSVTRDGCATRTMIVQRVLVLG